MGEERAELLADMVVSDEEDVDCVWTELLATTSLAENVGTGLDAKETLVLVLNIDGDLDKEGVTDAPEKEDEDDEVNEEVGGLVLILDCMETIAAATIMDCLRFVATRASTSCWNTNFQNLMVPSLCPVARVSPKTTPPLPPLLLLLLLLLSELLKVA
jgi:hypothetical protein